MAGRIAYYGNIVTNGLVLNLDSTEPLSYPLTGSTWFDTSLNSNNATLVNGPAYTGSNYGAIVFDGVDDTATFPSTFNATTAGLNGFHSVEMWIKPFRVDQPNDGLFRCLNTVSTNSYLHYLMRNSRFYLGWYSVDVLGNVILTANNWYHVVFMFGSDMVQRIYTNGTLDAAGPVLGSFFNGGVAPISLAYYATYFQGLMSVVRVYNRGLSAAEISQNFNAYRTRYGI